MKNELVYVSNHHVFLSIYFVLLFQPGEFYSVFQATPTVSLPGKIGHFFINVSWHCASWCLCHGCLSDRVTACSTGAWAWTLISGRRDCIPVLPSTYFVILDKFIHKIEVSSSELIPISYDFFKEYVKRLPGGGCSVLGRPHLRGLSHCPSASPASAKTLAHSRTEGMVVKRT